MNFRFYTVLLLIAMLAATGCGDSSPENKTAPADSTRSGEPKMIAGEAYTNAKYNVSLRVPDGWILMEEANLNSAMGTFGINIFKQGTEAANEVPLHIHAEAKHAFVAIWPHGYGTELPAGQRKSFTEAKNLPYLQFAVDKEESKVFEFKDGSVWAWFIVPKSPPENWEEHGFLFAQVRSTNNSATCFDEKTGKEIPMDRCDYLAGDRFVRQGTVDKNVSRTMQRLLGTIALGSVPNQAKASELIEIEQPLPNMDISSPLIVKGQARGQWYFEGSFRVELLDAGGNTLAETQAKAQGKWMTEDFVPFEATLRYNNAPYDERGKLIFHRANPSGLPENTMTWTQPVIFPPK